MRKFAHIINPFHVEGNSDLSTAQPVTFETMRVAREFSKDTVEIEFFSAQYPEDIDCVPSGFRATTHLDRSILDFGDFTIKRQLPLLRDILDRLYQASRAEYFMFTNVDIAVVPNFYLTVHAIIHKGFDAFVINRRTISSKYANIDEIPLMYSEIGESHKGFDCFIFRRDAYPRYTLGNVCVGTVWVGRVLLWNLVLNAKQFKEFKDLHLTFHLGDNQIWRNDKYVEYSDHNTCEAYKVLTEFRKNPGSLEILDSHTYLRLFDIQKLEYLEKTKYVNTIANTHTFLFIGGLHRSGTSIVFKCLREHSLISGFSDTGYDEDEGQFLQSVFPIARKFGGPGKFGFTPEMHLTEQSPLMTNESRVKLFFEWGKYWDTTRPVLLEKSPPNLLRTRFLQAMFPNSYFVIILRHPIATSYATQKWSKTDLKSLLQHWIHSHKIFFDDKKYLKNCLIIRYEDFCDDPNSCLKQIYNLIGIEAIDNTLEIMKNTNEKYLEQWDEARKRMNVFQKILCRVEYGKLEREINAFGYSLYHAS